jgi:hypothetical protein
MLFGPDRRAVDLERRLRSDVPRSPSGGQPVADPQLALGAVRDSFATSPRLLVGRVIDAWAYARTYRVACEGVYGQIRCSDSGHGSFGLSGARPLHTYRPGTQVLVVHYPALMHGVILCAIPDYGIDPSHGVGDMIAQGSNVGIQCDPVHRAATGAAGGIIDFSGGRPIDSLAVGEWGAISEHGLRVFLDPFMAQVGLDELTGLQVFLMDQLTRLGGRNLQIRSAGHEREDVDDGGEFSSWSLWTPSVAEAIGSRRGAEGAHLNPYFFLGRTDGGPLEPQAARGAYRQSEFRGYLGQGGRRTVGITTILDGVVPQLAGAFDESIGADGGYTMRSSRAVIIAKTPYIPYPRQAYTPPDGNGSDPVEPGTQDVTGWPRTKLDEDAQTEAATVFDAAAYAWAWKANHPFRYKADDWHMELESEFGVPIPSTVPPFAVLKTDTFLPMAARYTLQVDERYGLQEYYVNAAMIALLPQGGIVIAGGGGEEIRMVGGSVVTCAPGDVVALAGRNTVQMGGWDSHVIGHNCVDVSSSRGSVRVKADRDILTVSGNSGCGLTLLENRGLGVAYNVNASCASDSSTGVLVRAKDSAFIVLAKHALISVDALAGQTNHTNKIVLDAGQTGTIYTKSNEFHRHVFRCALDFIGKNSQTVTHEYFPDGTRLSTSVYIKGDTWSAGLVGAKDGFWTDKNVIADEYRNPDDEVKRSLKVVFDNIAKRNMNLVRERSAMHITWVQDWSRLKDVQFFFRESKHLLTTNFRLHQPLWHQQAMAGGAVLPKWFEPVVTHRRRPTGQAWPGYETWHAGQRYGIYRSTLFDWATSSAADGSDPTIDLAELGMVDGQMSRVLPPVEWTTLMDNLLVIAQPRGDGGKPD